MSEQPELGVVFNERTRTLDTQRGVWSIEAKHSRLGGDVDVILGFRPHGVSRPVLFGFRRDQRVWIQLAGSWRDRYAAVRDVARTLKTQVVADESQVTIVERVLPLLNLAATLPDHASHEQIDQARQELASRVEPDRARQEYEREKADDLREGGA